MAKKKQEILFSGFTDIYIYTHTHTHIFIYLFIYYSTNNLERLKIISNTMSIFS